MARRGIYTMCHIICLYADWAICQSSDACLRSFCHCGAVRAGLLSSHASAVPQGGLVRLVQPTSTSGSRV